MADKTTIEEDVWAMACYSLDCGYGYEDHTQRERDAMVDAIKVRIGDLRRERDDEKAEREREVAHLQRTIMVHESALPNLPPAKLHLVQRLIRYLGHINRLEKAAVRAVATLSRAMDAVQSDPPHTEGLADEFDKRVHEITEVVGQDFLPEDQDDD